MGQSERPLDKVDGYWNYLAIFLSVIYIFYTVVFVPSRADLFSDLSDSGHFEDFEVPLRTFRIQPKHFYDS